MSNSHADDEQRRPRYMRPFHSVDRDLQQEPDEGEPLVSSYSEMPFLADFDFSMAAPCASQKNKHKTRSRSTNKSNNNVTARGKSPMNSSSRSYDNLKTETASTTMHRVQSTSSVIVEVTESDMLPPNNHAASTSSSDITNANKTVYPDSSLPQHWQFNDSGGAFVHRESSSQAECLDYRTTSTTTPHTTSKREKQIKNHTKRKSHQQARLEKMKEKSSHERDMLSGYGVGYGGDLDGFTETHKYRSPSSPTTINTRGSSYGIDEYNDDYDDRVDDNLSSGVNMKIKHRIQEFCREQNGKSKPKLILSNLKINARNIPLDQILSLPYIYKLSLSQNNLCSVPPELVDGSLYGLTTLDLQKCNLSEVPEAWNLESLKRLDLSHNRLQMLTEVGVVISFYFSLLSCDNS